MLTFLLFLCLGSQAGAQNAAAINFGSTDQAITGLGGGITNSDFWLQPALSSAAADILFCNGAGQLGLSLLRVDIDPGGENPDPSLQGKPDDDGWGWTPQMTGAKEAEACGAQVFATPWSAPESMTSNGTLFGAANGATLTAVSLQNEPNTPSPYNGYNNWTAAQFDSWLAGNGSAISGARIMFPEAQGFGPSLAIRRWKIPVRRSTSESSADIVMEESIYLRFPCDESGNTRVDDRMHYRRIREYDTRVVLGHGHGPINCQMDECWLQRLF